MKKISDQCLNFNKITVAKSLIVAGMAAMAMGSLAGCASDERHASSDSSATTMSSDSKDMTHHSYSNSH